MRKASVVFVGVVMIGLCCGLNSVLAQESKTGGPRVQEQHKDSSDAQERVIKPYRLDFSLNEVEDGKTINTRHYSMNLTLGDRNEIKIGTRVPVLTGSVGSDSKNTQFQYLDVGTRIDARLDGRGEESELHVNSEISNIDTTTNPHSQEVNAPIIRQIKLEGSTLLVIGKPILIGSVDDPNSKRQFQLEVTVTKLR